MSSKLYWVPSKNLGEILPDDLKCALVKRYGAPISTVIGMRDIQYFEGLRDAGVLGAERLMAALEKHGEIHLNEQSY